MEAFKIVQRDVVQPVTSPINYNIKNPILKLMNWMEAATVMAEALNCYVADSLQYLCPFDQLEIYGPTGNDNVVLNPALQDNKTDFQKQNVKDFTTTDTFLMRGWLSVGSWTGSFLKLSYLGGPDSKLSQQTGHQLGDHIFVWGKFGNRSMAEPVRVPYNDETHRYEIEIWGYEGDDIRQHLSSRGQEALERGQILIRPDWVSGRIEAFSREGLDGRNMYEVASGHSMHPLLPLEISLAWSDASQQIWDSLDGKNYHYAFNMIQRGWNSYVEVGVSGNPHGGVGFLHYRNLLSNYKSFSQLSELSRTVHPWMLGADHQKAGITREENFLSVEYIDLHILKSECAIGIHRHRDNQEIFCLMDGKALMITGDWCEFENRSRAFEIRTLMPGSLALLKAGQLHALVNALDIDATLLMFGGYD